MMNLSAVNTTTVNPWVLNPSQKANARLRLFCFPYAGGGAAIYRAWPAGLPKSVEVRPVQLPGREGRLREAPFSSLRPMVEAVGEALLPLLDMPFAFFGHSMGGILSFELARWLRREHGLAPEHLFVSARWAPQVIDEDPPTYNLPEAEFLEEVRSLNGTPEEVLKHPELLQLILPLLRADFEVCQAYTYEAEPPLNCPLTVYGGLMDETVERHKLEGWREHTTGPFTLRMFPGNHFFLNSDRSLLLHTLSQDLERFMHTMK